MIAIDLSKQQALDADPRATQQINFTAIFFIIEEAKETFFGLFTKNCKSIANML